MSVVVVSARVNSVDLNELTRVKGVVVFPRPSKNETTLWKLEPQPKSTRFTVGVTLSPSLGKEHVAVAVQGVVECLFDEKTNQGRTPHIGTLLVPNNNGKLQCATETSGMKDVVATYLQHTTKGRALVFLQRVDETPTSSSAAKPPPPTFKGAAATTTTSSVSTAGLVGGVARASSSESVPPPLARDTPHPVVIKRVPPRAVASMAQRVKRGATLGDTPQLKKPRSRAPAAPHGTRK